MSRLMQRLAERREVRQQAAAVCAWCLSEFNGRGAPGCPGYCHRTTTTRRASASAPWIP